MATVNVADNRYGVAKYIVAPTIAEGANFTTIASALTAASSGETIFIRPGTYTENLTLKAGVNLCAFVGDPFTPNVTIVGKLSASFAGSCSVSCINLRTNSDYCLEITGSSNTIVNINNCYIDVVDNTAINYTSSGSSSFLSLNYCNSDSSDTGISFFTKSGVGEIYLGFCKIFNSANSTTHSTVSGGVIRMQFCSFQYGITTSSEGWLTTVFCNIITPGTSLIVGNSGLVDTNLSQTILSSDTSVTLTSNTVTVIKSCQLYTTNATAINGSGSIDYDTISFPGNKAITCTANEHWGLIGKVIVENDCQIRSGSGSPSGSITAPKGSLFLRDDGSSTSTRAYINTNGSTSWTAITTAS